MCRRTMLLVTVLLMSACAGGDPGGVVEAGASSGLRDFRVWGATSVVLGTSTLVGASRQRESGDSVLVHATWISRAPSVASAAGRGPYADVSGLALGRAWIVAFTNTAADSIEIAVVDGGQGGTDTTTVGSGPVASVGLRPASYAVAVGDSAGFYAEPLDANGHPLANRVIMWSVSNTDVTAVEFESGPHLILRARRVGTVTVTATSEGNSSTASVSVKQ